ncbi:MAG: hypothetical protein DMF79_06005 [Acidobacteria bacterium]|nr:MAG: hypothetical protein DMF79_06005 [Acidobacteriota bacterium]
MLHRLAAVLLLALGLSGCLKYEYEHEFWLRVDGSGAVNVTGRPALWTAFKGLGNPRDPETTATREAARALFERSGLQVKRVTVTRREGRPYLFVSAEFEDVNRLSGTPAFPDLRIGLRREQDRLIVEGAWARPKDAPDVGAPDRDGLMAVRFHLPSKVFGHKNAADGVERGNILGWRQEVAQGLDGRGLDFGAEMDERSILLSTVVLFASAIAIAVLLLAGALWAVMRRGRKELTAGDPAP